MDVGQKMELTVDTGVLSVDVINTNGTKLGEFEINPTDTAILSRREKVAEALNALTVTAEKTEEDRVEEVKELDRAIMAQFDYLLAYDVSDGIFGRCGPLTLLESGEFYYQNVLRGIDRLIEQVMSERVEKKMQKIEKATAKYSKKK